MTSWSQLRLWSCRVPPKSTKSFNQLISINVELLQCHNERGWYGNMWTLNIRWISTGISIVPFSWVYAVYCMGKFPSQLRSVSQTTKLCFSILVYCAANGQKQWRCQSRSHFNPEHHSFESSRWSWFVVTQRSERWAISYFKVSLWSSGGV